jgi:hypothetical protein
MNILCYYDSYLPFILKVKVGFHIHTDHKEGSNYWHGDSPDSIARAIVNAGLNAVAITEHNRVTDRVFAVREELVKMGRSDIIVLLGSELTLMYGEHAYHFGYVFEQDFEGYQLPDLPECHSPLETISELRKRYPGVLLFNHPTWRDAGICKPRRGTRFPQITSGLMRHPSIDGVEVFNASLIFHGDSVKASRITSSALSMFRSSQNRTSGKAVIGSSDAHDGVGGKRNLSHSLIGRAFTECSVSELSREEILNAVQEQRTSAVVVGATGRLIGDFERVHGRLKPSLQGRIILKSAA